MVIILMYRSCELKLYILFYNRRVVVMGGALFWFVLDKLLKRGVCKFASFFMYSVVCDKFILVLLCIVRGRQIKVVAFWMCVRRAGATAAAALLYL